LVMLDRLDHLMAPFMKRAAITGAALSMLVIPAGVAWPQAAPPASSPGVQGSGVKESGVHEPAQRPAPQQGEPAAPPPPPAGEESSGFFNEIGKLFEKLPTLKSSQEAIDDLNARANDAARSATDTLSRLTKPSLVTGRTICPVSANGMPDCKIGADKLCQTKGFKEGKSLNTDSAQTCSAKVLIPGRTRKPDDCRSDYYVTSALCQ
jgi:hypothetical protein